MMKSQRFSQSMNKFKVIALLLGLLIVTCNHKKDRLFINPSSQETGLNFNNIITETNDLSILDYLYFYNGGGVAIGDINNDDLPDIFLSGNQVKNKLFLNKGNFKFEDISEKANIQGNSSWNTGAVRETFPKGGGLAAVSSHHGSQSDGSGTTAASLFCGICARNAATGGSPLQY